MIMSYDDMITGRFHLIGDISITVEQRVLRAAECYLQKAGSYPNRAHVNPKICNLPFSIEFQGHPIQVYPDPQMLEHITWIGMGKPEFLKERS
jgi:hypothetical protein